MAVKSQHSMTFFHQTVRICLGVDALHADRMLGRTEIPERRSLLRKLCRLPTKKARPNSRRPGLESGAIPRTRCCAVHGGGSSKTPS